jgi:hypothetical protein
MQKMPKTSTPQCDYSKIEFKKKPTRWKWCEIFRNTGHLALDHTGNATSMAIEDITKMGNEMGN